MIKWTKVLVASMCFVAGSAMAAGKIAVVDLERALFESEGAKSSFKL